MEIPNSDRASLLRKIESSAGTTNKNILSDLEGGQVHNLIHDTEGVLSSLDREIELLIARRVVVAGHLSRLRIAVAPHKRLPPEILSAIIARAVDHDERLKFPLDLSQTAWALRNVCSTWRSVALGEPSLWNCILINTDEMDSRLVETITPLIHYILPPSGPISISLISNDSESYSPHIITHVVQPTLQRIKDLTLSVSLATFTTFLRLLTMPRGQLCSLESMSLDVWRQWNVHDDAVDVIAEDIKHATAFQQATRFRKLNISAYGSLSPDLFLHLPLPSAWSRLTSLRLATILSLKMSDVHRILLRCSSLVNVSMSLSCCSGNSLVDMLDMGKAMALPHLRSVQLSGDIEQPHSVLHIPVPWDQLTTLDIYDLQSVTLSETHHLLCGCTQLEELFITFRGDYEPNVEHPRDMITLARLRYMKVNSYMSGDLINILVMPALETLLIRSNVMPIEDVSNMIVRSCCFLSKFGYDSPLFLDEKNAIRQLLAHMPCLADFDTPKIALDSEVMQDIAKGSLLPLMRHFSCYLSSARSFQLFMATLERGRDQEVSLRGSGLAGTLRRATGNYIVNSDADYASQIHEMVRRTEELNKVYGTTFKLVSWTG